MESKPDMLSSLFSSDSFSESKDSENEFINEFVDSGDLKTSEDSEESEEVTLNLF